MISSPPGSLVQRAPWCVALGLVAAFFLPGRADARYVPQDDSPPVIAYSIDGTPGNNNWYRGSASGNFIVVHWSVSDPNGPILSTNGCEPAVRIDDPNMGTTRTCSATSDGGTTTVTTKMLKVDATPPTATVAPSRAPNAAGWYRSAVSLTWSGSDSTSGLASCSPPASYSGPDAAAVTENGTCTDNAGNSSAAQLTLHYDSTAPSTTPSPSPAPNANGWLKSNSGVQVSWKGSDGTSGIASCDGPTTYNGSDTAGTTVSGTCTDKAGNTSSAAFTVRLDTVAPTTTAIPARAANAAGWYRAPVTISGSGTDSLSGIDSCTSTTYSGPETTGTNAGVTCTDKAGNSSIGVLTVKYDIAPPSVTVAAARSPDQGGWYNHPVGVTSSGTDATSGIASCSSPMYTGPDGANVTATGSCIDNAGNTASSSVALQYDSTPPTVTVSAARPADHDGWYTQPVLISWSGTDGTSGIASCTPAVTYSGPDSSNASSGGGCTDRAGNSASPPALAFRYDATPPTVQPVASRPPDANGWYNHALSVGWSGADPVSGVASCSSYSYDGPDAAAVQPSGVCTDKAGNTSAPVAFGFRFDATPPTGVAAAPARPPDHDGWYNRPFAVKWSGADALSGIASCSTATYGGPTSGASAVSGSCTDQAGNTSGAVGYAFRYDSTPPAFDALSLTPRDDSVTVRWRASGATAFKVTRKPGVGGSASSVVYVGRASSFADRKVDNYVRYRYVVTAEDDAGNVLSRSGATTPMPVLYAPRPGARLSPGSAPLLAWRAARKARYYNVQLWLDGRSIGSWWPTRPRLKLPARWRFGGSARTLEAGAYTWYVWPGHGSRRLGRYGPLLGKSTFVVGSG